MNALNASRRNWAIKRPIFWFLNSDRSATLRPGARSELRRRVAEHAGAPAREKTDGSNHWSAVPGYVTAPLTFGFCRPVSLWRSPT